MPCYLLLCCPGLQVPRAAVTRAAWPGLPRPVEVGDNVRVPLPELLQWTLRGVLAAVFVFMGVTHFIPKIARGMAAMIPPALNRPGWPSGAWLVAFTGVCEIAGGIGLLVPATQFAAGMALVLFLVAVFPANSYASLHPERFGRAAFAFWPRYVAQLVLVLLCALAAI